MSVAYILNQTYSFVENSKLNPALEVATSLKAPVHYVQDVGMSQTIDGNLSIDAPVIECIQLEAGIGVFDTSISTAEIVPNDGIGGSILVDGSLDFQSAGSLLNVDKLTLGSGAPVAGYVLSATDVDGTLAWIPDAAGDVSQWSTYNAVSDVNLGSNNLNCSKSISDDAWVSYISLPKDGSSSSMYLNSFTNTAKIPNLLVDSLDTTDPLSTQINVNKNLNLSSHIIYASTGNFGSSITSVNTFLGVEPNRWSGGGGEVYVLQQLNNDNAVRSISGADFTGFHDIESKRGKFYTTNEASEEKFSANQDGQVLCEQIIPNYKAERVLWVSPNNTYATPNGSYENPYTTIQAAVTFAESNYTNEYWYINVLPGTYAGFTVTKKVFIKGAAPSNPDACSVGCQINSDIIINLDSNDGDMFNNCFGLSGFLVSGCKIVDSSSARHVLNITDCYFYNDSGTGRSIDCRPSSTDCRLQIFNSKIVNVSPSGGDPMIEISVGMAKFLQTQFQCAGIQNCIKFSGTSRVDSIIHCLFTSTNPSATIPPIVEITSTSTSAFSFSNCAFIYTSATNKTASPSSCAIYGNSATTPAVITILYNTFSLAGTSDPQNHVINYNTVPSITFYFSNCAAPSTCSRINGTHTSFQAVV